MLILAIDTDSIAAWQIISKTQEDIATELAAEGLGLLTFDNRSMPAVQEAQLYFAGEASVLAISTQLTI